MKSRFYASNRFDYRLRKKYHNRGFSHARYMHYDGTNYKVKPLDRWRYKVSKR